MFFYLKLNFSLRGNSIYLFILLLPGYNSVAHIPRGASRLKVIQTSTKTGGHDSNFLGKSLNIYMLDLIVNYMQSPTLTVSNNLKCDSFTKIFLVFLSKYFNLVGCLGQSVVEPVTALWPKSSRFGHTYEYLAYLLT